MSFFFLINGRHKLHTAMNVKYYYTYQKNIKKNIIKKFFLSKYKKYSEVLFSHEYSVNSSCF